MPNTFSVDAFLGIRNVAQSRRQPKGSLAEAMNVDVDDEGSILRRPGYQKSLALTEVVSAFSPLNAYVTYVIDKVNGSGVLKRITPSLGVEILGTVPAQFTYWAEVGTQIFLSTGYVIDNDVLKSWSVNPPLAVTVQATGGSLPAGQYQVVCTTVASDGRESPTNAPVVLHLPDDGGIQLTGVSGCNVYVSDVNGAGFYFAGHSISYISTIDTAIPIDPALLYAAFPEGHLGPIAYYDSCMHVSQYDAVLAVSTVYWSRPFFWHIFNVFEDYIQVPGEVRLLYGSDQGLLIGTDRDIWMFNGESIARLASYGVPHGHNLALSKDGTVLFQTNWGVCTLPFQNLTAEKCVLPTGSYCNTAVMHTQAMSKLITLTDGTGSTELSTI